MHARKPQLCRIHCRHLAQACLAMASCSVVCIISAWLFTFYPYGIRLVSILTSTRGAADSVLLLFDCMDVRLPLRVMPTGIQRRFQGL